MLKLGCDVIWNVNTNILLKYHFLYKLPEICRLWIYSQQELLEMASPCARIFEQDVILLYCSEAEGFIYSAVPG